MFNVVICSYLQFCHSLHSSLILTNGTFFFFQITQITRKKKNEMAQPPKKNESTETTSNFKLYLKCQTVTNEPLRNNPKESSYSTFLNRLHQRADYGDAECIPIWKRLCTVTSDTLKDKAAVWHATYYASITNNVHLERARIGCNKKVLLQKTHHN